MRGKKAGGRGEKEEGKKEEKRREEGEGGKGGKGRRGKNDTPRGITPGPSAWWVKALTVELSS